MPTRKQRAKAKANVAKARTRDSMQAFSKLTHEVDGERRIIADPPLIVPIEDLLPPGRSASEVEEELRGLIRSYRRTLETDRRQLLEDFEYVHMARKVVGVGSVGTRAWILLLLGRDGQDPLFLQAKEAQESVLERFVGKSRYHNHGQRVVAGQRLMQAASDIFLGWQRVDRLRRAGPRLLRSAAAGLEGLGGRRHHGRPGDDAVRADVRGDPRPRPRPLRRPDRHRLLPGQQRRLRPGHRRLLQRLRRPERARLPGAGPRGRLRSARCTDWLLTRAWTGSAASLASSPDVPCEVVDTTIKSGRTTCAPRIWQVHSVGWSGDLCCVRSPEFRLML